MKISVIVPIYNVEAYLEKCLNSLVNQTLKDIEIIAINDGSTDKSGEILDRLSREHPQIKAINQENSGISATRNKGLSVSQGEYISFIDSDDSVSLDFCEKMLSKAEETGADITVCDYLEITEGTDEQRLVKLPEFSECTVFEKPDLLFNINASPWNKLYKRSYLSERGAEFPVGIKYEDTPFLHRLLASGAKLSKVDEPLIYYMVRPQSETTVVRKNVFDILKVLDMVYKAYNESALYDNVKAYLEYFMANRITVYSLQQVYQEERNAVNEFINKGYAYLDGKFPNWRKNPYFNAANSKAKRILKKNKFITKAVIWTLRLCKK